MTGSLLVSWNPHAFSVPTLLCLPQAGAGCGQFRAWQQLAGEALAVVGVQLPGREERFGEPSPESFSQVVTAIAEEVRSAHVDATTALVVFGYSFGGLLGYEVARCLRPDMLEALVIAACRPPSYWLGAKAGLAGPPAELERLFAGRGLDESELDEDSRELMLEVLKMDAGLSRTYVDSGDKPMDCVTHAWGGDRDQTVTAAQLDQWQLYTTKPLRRRTFAGDHYFGSSHREDMVSALAAMAGVVLETAGEGQSWSTPS